MGTWVKEAFTFQDLQRIMSRLIDRVPVFAELSQQELIDLLANAEKCTFGVEELAAEHRVADEERLGIRVQRALESSVLRGGGATEEAVAHALALSVRTLQRSLGEEGTSFRRIREEVLHRIGAQLLRESPIAVAEIASRLGFANVTAFGKAFRRWSGATPSAYRSAAARTRTAGEQASAGADPDRPLRSAAR